MHPINYIVISDALYVYPKVYGYKYIEVPWVIGEEALKATLPPDRKGIHCDDGALVGSAEQSFIQLMLEENLQDGKYIAATPCFRDEEIDTLHQRYFFKVELIEYSHKPFDNAKNNVSVMAHQALDFFRITQKQLDIKIVETDIGLDIELNGVEIGSYGYRNYKNNHWIYGTGLAEPRFSQAIIAKQ